MKKLESLSLRYENGKLSVLDQRLLPQQEVWRSVPNPQVIIELIQCLAVRGAPMIGISAALSLAAYSLEEKSESRLRVAARALRESRPTAVNLMNYMDRMIEALDQQGPDALEEEAIRIFEEDVELCRKMAERGAELIQDGDSILTHCNTGALATAGVGTALGVIRVAHESGKKIHVYVDETRPLLQGARLTAWELQKLNIPFTLICDNMAASLMKQKKVQKVFVGADRIACNGDVANKIGTYGLAVVAHYHQVPFYVVAPSTTLDPNCKEGANIPIEERDPEEVRAGKALSSTKVWNPAFDVTPRALIRGIILEDRVL